MFSSHPRIFLLLLCLPYILLLALGVFYWLSRRKTPITDVEKSRDPEQQSDDTANVGPDLTGYPIRVIVESTPPPPPPSEKQKAKEERQETREDRKYRAEITAAFIGVGLLVINILLWCSTRRAAQAANASANIALESQRAWITPPESMKIKIITVSPSESKLIPDYKIQNIGHSPAFTVFSNSQLIINFGEDSEPETTKSVDDTARSVCQDITEWRFGSGNMHSTVPGGFTLFPGQPVTIPREPPGTNDKGLTISKKNFSAVKELWVVGCTTYFDKFRGPHWTRFCFTTQDSGPITLGSNLTWNYYFLYNDTDEMNNPHPY